MNPSLLDLLKALERRLCRVFDIYGMQPGDHDLLVSLRSTIATIEKEAQP